MIIHNIAAVLPSYIDEKNDWVGPDIKLSSLEISYMVGIFSVAQMIATPLNSRGKNRFGAKNYIVIGWVVLTAATLGTGLTVYIDNKVTFLVVTCCLRFLSGGSDTMIQITLYSVLTEMYKEDVNIVFRYMEICVNVGYAAGPIIGAVVYSGLKYGGTMYLFGGINGLCLIFSIFMIPNSVNETKERGDLSR